LDKRKSYPQTRFTADTIREAELAFGGILPEGSEVRPNFRQLRRGDEQWNFDSDEEFFAEYRNSAGLDWINYEKFVTPQVGTYNFLLGVEYDTTLVKITAPSRPQIEAVFEVFERHVLDSKTPPVP
jgi:hypothetical protein